MFKCDYNLMMVPKETVSQGVWVYVFNITLPPQNPCTIISKLLFILTGDENNVAKLTYQLVMKTTSLNKRINENNIENRY